MEIGPLLASGPPRLLVCVLVCSNGPSALWHHIVAMACPTPTDIRHPLVRRSETLKQFTRVWILLAPPR